MTPEPNFFKNPGEWRRWLAKHHADATELWVGFYKKSSDKTGITYAEALDLALIYGWIDGVRKSIDAERWTIRFTPRKPTSIWSNVNIKRARELIAEGKMLESGRKAFEARTPAKSGVYSAEQPRSAVKLDPAEEKRFRQNKRAWEYFEKQAPTYRHAATWWIISAKKPETRVRRLDLLIADSDKSKRLDHLTSYSRR